MKIRNAVVNGVRVFSVCDVAALLGVAAQSLTLTVDRSAMFYFNGSHEDGGKRPNLAGLPYHEIEQVIQRRLKRDRIGNDVAPSILEWMKQQPDLEKQVEEVEIRRDFEQMTSEEIYEAGLTDEFLEFVAKEKEKVAERNNSIRTINLGKLELQKLRDELKANH